MDMHLMPHQEKVLEQTEQFNRVAYYLDMGLGKTFVGSEKLWQLNNETNLVVCQKSKIDDWVQHFKTYYPEDIVLDLTKRQQAQDFMGYYQQGVEDGERQIIGVINYDLIFRRSSYLDLFHFTLLLDESSLISNENTKRAKYIMKMHPAAVILLSGTPTAGKYEKLWSQLKLLGWKISKEGYYRSYVETEWIENGDGFKQEVITGYKNVWHLKKRLKEYGAVFLKTEQVLNLPEQIEQEIMLKKTKDYVRFMKERYLMMDDGTELVGDNSLTRILYGRQLCGHFHKEKLEAFRDILESTEDRVVVFYNYNAELDALKTIAEGLDRPVSQVNGKTKDLYSYHNYENSVTLIQYQAGAMGGNYQMANKVVYFTLPLGKGSCDLWTQSKKRIHRIGQKKPCFYYYLLVQDSIETKNFEALKEGKELTDDLFENL